MEVRTIPGKGPSSNVHIIMDEKIAIIDAGIHEIADETLMEIRAVTERKPDFLILTHRHVDHIGAAKDIADWAGCTILAGEKDADAIREADEWSTGSGDFGLAVFPVELKVLREGDRINLGKHALSVIETPGHTVGSISLYEEDTGALFPGDTLFADGGVGRWDLPTGDFQSLRESIERLSNMEVNSLYPGHGRSVEKDADMHIRMSLNALLYYY